ncbi:class I adenylate-forming enzyme family protein [Pontixanthobacter aestiaquae]|uniref:AMP-binding protein n=1 Tax=Pontixanthobacter aestiaquae TaxID=1509367 RepID=A0A844Z332_9SPHN|nr:class I adenylate-forming enzyme family protein [Pontixanthobacter aestiaquae]MDN3646672.1 class I adenylate-forming enzyme family protein [Pontixanthobacter aestiaquae]MXO82345.1 AMP-binding protein [Pontixanthobacter aestiaquae]
MPTELDTALNTIMDALAAPGQPFETVDYEDFGVTMPAFKNAPPSLAHYFAHYCNEHKDLTFLVDGDIRLTFGETYAAAVHVAAGLAQNHGIKKGDRIGIAARNSANWIISYMGIIMAGGCATLLNGFSTGSELADAINLAECTIVLADDGRAQRLEGNDHCAKVVLIDHDGPPSKGLESIWGEGNTAMAMLGELGPDDLATILYTSGSTGASKGAYSDHRGVMAGTMSYIGQSAMAKILLTQQGNEPTDQPCALIAVPLFHVTGEVPLFLQSYGIARKLVMMPKWDALHALELMEAEKVSYFVGVPLMSYEIATHPDRDKYDLTACKSFAAGGAPRPTDHVTKIKEAFPEGFPLLGYGLTETNGVGCGNFNENYMAKPGSTGKASRPIVEIAILDDDGNHMEQGAIGEVCFRTVANFKGYWRNEKATKAAFTDDGFFRTGDLGYLDEDEYLFIVDRKKDIIIRGGENITCIEVEAGIYAHEGIAECSVFGVPCERMGEVPAAVYHMKDGHSMTPEQVREFMLEKLAPFKVPLPEHIWQSDEPLPRLGTQKIDKRTVRTMFASDLLD